MVGRTRSWEKKEGLAFKNARNTSFFLLFQKKENILGWKAEKSKEFKLIFWILT